MKLRSVIALAALAISSMPTTVLVVVALLTGDSNAASLQPSETRQDWQDLEVITPVPGAFYTEEERERS
jgi:hypothetical protein